MVPVIVILEKKIQHWISIHLSTSKTHHTTMYQKLSFNHHPVNHPADAVHHQKSSPHKNSHPKKTNFSIIEHHISIHLTPSTPGPYKYHLINPPFPRKNQIFSTEGKEEDYFSLQSSCPSRCTMTLSCVQNLKMTRHKNSNNKHAGKYFPYQDWYHPSCCGVDGFL